VPNINHRGSPLATHMVEPAGRSAGLSAEGWGCLENQQQRVEKVPATAAFDDPIRFSVANKAAPP